MKRQVAGFIGQESMHGREHRVFNNRLAELGYPTERIARLTKGLLEFRERQTSPKARLAVTAALEHFTAALAELLMTSDEARAMFGHDAVRELRDYNRPGFHPDDSDTTELVTQWRQALFGEDGTLNDKLVTAAA